MVRDLEKEAQKIRNGNRYIEDTSGNGVFARDPERLLKEYTNLRKKLYSTYAGSFADDATRRELRSYIDEQFVKLVKEYDINNPVDFPGYIDKKLKLRVKQTFIKNQFRDKKRERLTGSDNGVELLMDAYEYDEMDLDDVGILDSIFSGVSFSEEELFIINSWVTTSQTDKMLTQNLMEEFAMTKREADVLIKGMKEFVTFKLEEYNKED